MAFRKKKIGNSTYRRPGSSARRRLPKRRRTPGKTLSERQEKPKITERRKRQKIRTRSVWGQIKRSLMFIGIGFVVVYLSYALFLSGTLTIEDIEVIENDIKISDHSIHTLLADFKGSNLLLFNADELEPFFKTQYPQYETLNISKNLPDTIRVTLKTYPVVASLMVETDEGNEQQFFLTRAGQTAEYDELSATEQGFREIYITSEQSLSPGTTVITQDRLAFILEAIQSFEDRFGMAVQYAEYHSIERETHLYTEREFFVWLDMTMDLDEQFDKLKKGLPRLDIYEMDLIYVDLRISGINGEKIIFKPA